MSLEHRHTSIGAVYMVAASLSLSILSALAKLLSDLNSWEIVFFQALVAFLLIAPRTIRSEHGLTFPSPVILILRGIAGSVAWWMIFLALQAISVTDVVLAINTSPLFVPFLAWLLLKDRPTLLMWPGILLGFGGIALILRPDKELFDPAIFYALGAGLIIALVYILIKKLTQKHHPILILFYYFLIAALFALPFALFRWQTPTLYQWILLVLTGLSLFSFQMNVNFALKYGSATALAPITYLSIIWSALIEWIFWNTLPTWMTALGALLVVIGGIWTLVAHHKRAKV